ncbi:NAD(P)/FAD-dependent oxidoreductase [Halorubrum vacuolatum]|uniref:Glycine/D-amino acid oxidase n=1 Tax=Halorubrum vacuolatum TaxID=63740 RepID=A0A238VKL0_HALVU|nr:FAD-binding oxidoreductase [Halorubrum vacuolatum]SNR34704.1 Glycine/D-amino acid oxidase [Halorubrum vacuolatum]
MSDQTRVAIVGGGVTGCAIARALAPDHAVDVFDQGQIAGEATALAAGEITMLSSYDDRPAIGWHAVEFFRDYDGTGTFSFAERPSIGLITPDREEAKRRYAARAADNGLPVAFLDRETAAGRYPRFDFSGFAGVVEHGVSGFVDPYTFAVTLQHDAEADSARFHTNTPVTDVLTDGGAVTGVEAGGERYDADHVIVAAGWRSRAVLSDQVNVEIPIRPYRTQCIVLEPEEPLPDSFPMGWYPGEHVYFRAEHNGDLLVGGWSFAEDDPEGASSNADEAFRRHVADLLPTFLQNGDRAGYVDDWAGIDAATPDTRPILDTPAEGPDGLVVATGFNGRGIMTAPVSATVVRSLITDETAPFSTDPFALDRFDTRSADFEFISISASE